MNILIINGRVVDPENGVNAPLDVYIENGVIAAIGECLDEYSDNSEVIDAQGLIVSPGLVDMHCHLREPGFEYKEDIESGTKSAALGGFTSVACMPNTNPIADNVPVISFILGRAAERGVVNVFPIGAITQGQKGEALAPICEMFLNGAVAISDDGRPVMNSGLMRNAMIYAGMFGVPVISHCEELTISGSGVMNDGYMSTELGLAGIPGSSEEVMVARECVLAGETGVPVHIAHVSTARSVQLVRDAKNSGIPVTCETCPHYMLLTEEAVAGFNTNAKMNPPLRAAADRDAIIQGLVDGTIDAIATDHAPHHFDEKEIEFDRAMFGVIGFETALAVALTTLRETGLMSLSAVLAKLTSVPSRILKIPTGSIPVGARADITIFDAKAKWTVGDSFASKSRNSAFIGMELTGKTLHTIVGGKIVVMHGELV